ncbi:glycosyltransferase [Symmachiella dynata]|uniref:glycosyltransferase n=1 Tax=Symmachiella dynata TaxID=2527995 RepID=UPI0030EF6511
MRIAVVTPIPTPYRDPFWNEVARVPGVELSVFYCSAGKTDRPWESEWDCDYDAHILPGINLSRWRGASASTYWNSDIVNRLRAGQFEAIIIGGYNHVTMWAAMRFAKRQGIPFFLMCESHLKKERQSWKRWVKRPVVQWVVKHAAGGFPTGTLAGRYLESYGAQPSTLAHVPNAPDVEMIAAKTSDLRSRRNHLRREHGLDDGPVALFVGRLIPMKRVDLLIRAFQAAPVSQSADLVIVGDGPMRSELEAMVADLGLTSRVHFVGFAQPSQVVEWYSLADLFVLPSSEPWGVVVLEALAAGLPVIVTDQVGCHPDVVNSPLVGDIVPAGRIEELTAALQRRLSQANVCSTVQKEWAPVFQSLCYNRIAHNFVQNIRTGNACRTTSVTGAH